MHRTSTLISALVFCLVLPGCSDDDSDTSATDGTDADDGTDPEDGTDTGTDTDGGTDADTDPDTDVVTDLSAWGTVQLFDDQVNTTFRALAIGPAGEVILVGETSEFGGTASQLWSVDEDIAVVRQVAVLPDGDAGPPDGRGFALVVTDPGDIYFASSTTVEGSGTERVATIHKLTPTGLTEVEDYSIGEDIDGAIIDYTEIRSLRESPDGDLIYAGFGGLSDVGPQDAWRYFFVRQLGIDGGDDGGDIIGGGATRDYLTSIDVADDGRVFGVAATNSGLNGLDLTVFRGSIDGPDSDEASTSLATTSDDFAGPVLTHGTDVYVAGSTSGVLFGETGMGRDPYLAKYDSDLNLQWGVQMVGPLGGFIETIVMDDDGHLYVTGAADFNGSRSTGFAASFTTSGVQRWTMGFGNSLNLVRPMAAVMAGDDLVIAGWIRPDAVVGGRDFLSQEIDAGADIAGFVLRIDPSDGSLR